MPVELNKYFDKNTKTIKAMMLYDSNDIKIDEAKRFGFREKEGKNVYRREK